MRNSAIKASTGDAPSSRGPDVAASSLNCPSAGAERAAALDIQRERLSKVQAEYIQNPSMDNTPDAGAEVRRLETLLDAARLLNSTLELKELTQIILDVVRAEVPVDRISVFVVDRGRNSLHSLVAQEVKDFEITLPIGAGTAGTVAATGEILDITDAYADPRFESRFDQILQYRTKDLFALPVNNRQGEIVGVLELINRQRPITAADHEFLLGISVYIGLALQNAWVHRQVRAEGRFEQELVALRDNLAEAEQISLTSELLSLVLQEISNPLAVAIGYAELASDFEPLPEKLRTYLEKITRGLDQTAAAARCFRQFIESGQQRGPLSLSGILTQISNLRAQEWSRLNIEASLFVQQVPDILASKRQMELVILYLIKTAERALLQSETKRELRMVLLATDENVRVEIYNSSHVQIPVIGYPLSQSASSGRPELTASGLDLAIASSIVRQHHGRVRIEHQAGGQNVILELPAYFAVDSLAE